MNREKRVQEVRRAAWSSRSIMSVVRAVCFDCMGATWSLVPGCSATACPLYPFRLGKKRSGFDEAANMLEREGFQDLAKKNREIRDTIRVFPAVEPEEDVAGDPVVEPDEPRIELAVKPKPVFRLGPVKEPK